MNFHGAFPPHRSGRHGGRKPKPRRVFSPRADRRTVIAPETPGTDWRDPKIFGELDRMIAAGVTRSGRPEPPEDDPDECEAPEKAKGAGA